MLRLTFFAQIQAGNILDLDGELTHAYSPIHPLRRPERRVTIDTRLWALLLI
jgi:hypothetical protein